MLQINLLARHSCQHFVCITGEASCIETFQVVANLSCNWVQVNVAFITYFPHNKLQVPQQSFIQQCKTLFMALLNNEITIKRNYVIFIMSKYSIY